LQMNGPLILFNRSACSVKHILLLCSPPPFPIRHPFFFSLLAFVRFPVYTPHFMAMLPPVPQVFSPFSLLTRMSFDVLPFPQWICVAPFFWEKFAHFFWFPHSHRVRIRGSLSFMDQRSPIVIASSSGSLLLGPRFSFI